MHDRILNSCFPNIRIEANGGSVGFGNEIGPVAFPVLADFHEGGSDQSHGRSVHRERRGDSGVAFDLLVDALQRAGRRESRQSSQVR